jgi:hypothetical protein
MLMMMVVVISLQLLISTDDDDVRMCRWCLYVCVLWGTNVSTLYKVK